MTRLDTGTAYAAVRDKLDPIGCHEHRPADLRGWQALAARSRLKRGDGTVDAIGEGRGGHDDRL